MTRGEIERGLGERILPVLEASLDDHLGPVWEETFRVHLRRMAAAGRLGKNIVAVGPWWSTDGTDELDAVVLAGRARRPVLVGEAKWATHVNATRITPELARKARTLMPDGTDLLQAVCARERVEHVPDGVIAVTAGDIFSAKLR